jgi:hypothetical protein
MEHCHCIAATSYNNIISDRDKLLNFYTNDFANLKKKFGNSTLRRPRQEKWMCCPYFAI